MKIIHYILLLIFICLHFSCSNNRSKSTISGEVLYKPKYAQGFLLESLGDTVILKVSNPWQFATDVEYKYILTPNESRAFNEIKIPVNNVICMSTTHISLLSSIDKLNEIKGVSGAGYISNPLIRLRLDQGKVVDIGYDASISYEKIMMLKPDVIFAYGIAGEFKAIEDKLNELGVKVVYLGEYMESDPLGKAEWLVAISSFFGDIETAKKIFLKIEQDYNDIKDRSTKIENKPKIMLNTPYNGVWYLPGRGSYMATFIKDAGGEYLYNEEAKESIPVNIEKAYMLTKDADIWLISCDAKDLKEFKSQFPTLLNLPAFRNKKIYNNNLRDRGQGNDFWESGIVNPHLILKDIASIIQNEVENSKLEYYRYLE